MKFRFRKPPASPFSALLARKRKAADAGPALPPGQRLLALRDRPVGVSFTAALLAREYPQLLPRLLPWAVPSDAEEAELADCALLLMLGAVLEDAPHRQKGTQRLLALDVPDDRKMFLEQAFLGSAFSWSPPHRTRPEAACLGYVCDDLAQYYMADYPSRLTRWLNSREGIPEAAAARARALMARIVSRRITKYNAQPMVRLAPSARRRVLVCDQSFDDASIRYGRMDARAFDAMLAAARAENPEAEILVKTHPDTAWTGGGRASYFDTLRAEEGLTLIREPMNPHCLIDAVDTVYVGTSQIGFEALMAGRRVVCFGAPWYAGWGLTDDRTEVPHRARRRTLEELFHAGYLWYPLYHVPGKPAPCAIEEVLDYIEAARPVAITDGAERAEAPEVSVVIPVHDGAAWLAETVASVQKQSLSRLEIILVDDASSDGTRAVMDRLAALDPRIVGLSHDAVRGPGHARNTGLDAARGDYVWLLDSDDRLIDAEVLADLLAEARATGADILRARKAGERVLDGEGRFVADRPDPAEARIAGGRAGALAELPELAHNRHCWLLLYRRALLDREGLRFATGFWEERAFALGALLAAERIATSDRAATLYHIRPDSVARRPKRPRDAEDMVGNLEAVVARFRDHGAAAPDSPLRGVLRITLTQFLHYLLFGFFRTVAAGADPETRAAWYARVAAAYARAGMWPEDLCRDVDVIDPGAFDAGRYQLALAALLAGAEEDLARALDETPCALPDLVARYRAAPDAPLTAALNAYATGARVLPAAPALRRAPQARVLIHAGMSKTGTTWLQHWLGANRPQLLAQGVWYPDCGLYVQPGRPHKTGGHAPFLAAAQTGDGALRDHVAAAVEISGAHTVLLSSEAFHLGPEPQRLADYFDGWRVEAVLWLRRQDDWAASQYREYVGGGATFPVSAPIGEWLASEQTRNRLCFSTILDPWAERLGRERLHLRRFGDGRLRPALGQVAGYAMVPGMREGPARLRNDAVLDDAWLEEMRRLNAGPFASVPAYLAFVEEVHALAARFRPEARAAEPLSAARRAALMADCAADSARVSRVYFGGEPLFAPEQGRIDPPAAAPLTGAERRAIHAAFRRHAVAPPPADAAGAALLARMRAEVRPLPPDRARIVARHIRAAGLFDDAWYLARNPDVAAAGMDPLIHFLQSGCAEGRDPSESFRTPDWYRARPDRLAAGENALVAALADGAQQRKV